MNTFEGKLVAEGLKIGMNKNDLKKVITSSAVFTVIPSVGILLGVITLSGSLGVPVPWLRLSVVGALHYEIMAADMAAKACGLQALSPEFMNPEILVTVVFVMAIGIIWGGIFCVIGLKKYQKTINKNAMYLESLLELLEGDNECLILANQILGETTYFYTTWNIVKGLI